MKLSYKWLQNYVDAALTPADVEKELTQVGLEVDSVSKVAGDFSGVVVGQVLSFEKHPDADKLNVCQVDVGEKEPLQIVCGASNVRQHMKVAVALVGAVLPGDFKIKQAKLRGVASFGMLSSEKELGLADSSNGIMDLPSDAAVGQDLRDYLDLDDVAIDVDLTPNRADCASVYGIARELSVVNHSAFSFVECVPVLPVSCATFPVELLKPEACPHYVGRVIKGINPKAQTPLWMQERLRRSGLRSLAPVVDVMNYVMLELGQPMHAFDLNQLSGGIFVRMAKEGESIALLNDQTVSLTENTLVIADEKAPVAIAGVMGGLDSSVTDKTTDIFLESAFFTPEYIAGRARDYGFQTDSSYRFERGVDFNLQESAIERATQLLLDIVGGEPGPVTLVESQTDMPEPVTIDFRVNKVEKLLGIAIPLDFIEETFNDLGMEVLVQKDIWQVKVPSFRFDIRIEEDLIEEVARFYGYHNIPVSHYAAALKVPEHFELPLARRIRYALQDRDFNEIVTYSFISQADQALFDPKNLPLSLLNPINQDMGVMRTTLWPSLCNTLAYNTARQQSRVRIFEIGPRFRLDGGAVLEETMLSGLVYGDVCAKQWAENSRKVDFFDVKGDVEALLSLIAKDFVWKSCELPALHPGKCAQIMQGDQCVGYLGCLHPELTSKKDLKGDVYLFELKLDGVLKSMQPAFKAPSKFPSIHRDLAFVMPIDIAVSRVEQMIRSICGELLADYGIFDVYQGDGIEKTQKSVALGLTFQHQTRTLNDGEIGELMDKIVSSMASDLRAILRA